jgi:MFS family permease
VLFSATLIGGGLGPLISGAISDAFTARYGPNGLRYALVIMMPLLLASGTCFFLFARTMHEDIEA